MKAEFKSEWKRSRPDIAVYIPQEELVRSDVFDRQPPGGTGKSG